MSRNFWSAIPIVLSFLLWTGPAFALDKIYSPYVEKGEWEFEYFGTSAFDDHHDKDGAQAHEVSLGYGLSSHWSAELYGLFERQIDQSIQFSGVQWENRFQFFEPGQYWVDSGLLVAYTHATHRDDPDTLEVKVLLQKQWGRFIHRTNIGIEQEVGSHSQGGPDRVVLWSSRYKYNKYFEPGFEIQSNFGKANEHLDFSQQEHYVGPAVYGLIAPHVKYEAAYLFGLSNAASDSAARLLLEYEMRF